MSRTAQGFPLAKEPSAGYTLAMRRALLAALLLAPATARADPACEAAWQDSYASDWGFPREKWLSACRAGLDAPSALKEAQSAFMAKCRERFMKPDARAAAAQAEIFCALGRPGRSKLYAMAGLPDEDAPPPLPPAAAGAEAPPANVPPPGIGGMGPLMQALRDARSKWKPDACFAGLAYHHVITPSTTDEEWQLAKRTHRDPAYALTSLEEHDYAFRSGEVKEGGYRVSYGDHVDTADCTNLRRGLGPDAGGLVNLPFFSRCLGSVKLDLPQALAVVFTKAAPASDVYAVLGTVTEEFMSRCEIQRSGRELQKCAEAPGWDLRSLKLAPGREVWAVMVGGRTDFVDAATGKRLGWARGDLAAGGALRSPLYGHSCPVPRLSLR